MRRRLFTILSVPSLLLCVATVALWARSHSVSETIVRDTRTRAFEARTGVGSISFGTLWRREQSRAAAAWSYHRRPPEYPRLIADQRVWHLKLEFELSRFRGIIVPYSAIAAAFLVAPFAHGVNLVRSGRRRSGHCRSCGYDLRATPDRCPECGTKAVSATPLPAQN